MLASWQLIGSVISCQEIVSLTQCHLHLIIGMKAYYRDLLFPNIHLAQYQQSFILHL